MALKQLHMKVKFEEYVRKWLNEYKLDILDILILYMNSSDGDIEYINISLK